MSVRFAAMVRIRLFTSAIGEVFAQAAEWSLVSRVEVEVTAIAAGPGAGVFESLHAYDLAVDLAPVGDKPGELTSLGEWLRHRLSPPFDVFFEGSRVHVEWSADRPPLRRLS